MENNIILKGLKIKVCFEESVTSLKLVNECDEKFCKKLKYEKVESKDEKAILTFRKWLNNVKYKVSLKEDHISIYVEDVIRSRIDEYLSEMVQCLNLFRVIAYNYKGENPKITSVIFTKGYDAKERSFTEYLQRSNSSFNRDGVSISFKYVDKKDMNLLIRTYLRSNKKLKKFFDNVEEYINLLYEVNL